MTQIKAEKRDIFGKKLSHARKEGKLPACVYGPKNEPLSLFVNTHDFEALLKEAGETSTVSLETEGDTKDVMIHDVTFDPVKGFPIHVDFYEFEKGKKVTVAVPLEFEGVSPAVKSLGGTLIKVMHEIEVEAQPTNIPSEIVVDISGLTDFDSHVTIKDIALPAGVVATLDVDEVIASVAEPREEEEEETTEAADLSSIEVEKKGKAEEEGEESSEEKKGDK